MRSSAAAGDRCCRLTPGRPKRRHADEPVDTLDPEALFERRWALTILERAMARLRQELVGTGRDAEFEQLEGYLTGREPKVQYQEAAERLGTTEGAVKKMVHRLRRRFGHLLREEIAATRGGSGRRRIGTASPAVGREAVGAPQVTFLRAFVLQSRGG